MSIKAFPQWIALSALYRQSTLNLRQPRGPGPALIDLPQGALLAIIVLLRSTYD